MNTSLRANYVRNINLKLSKHRAMGKNSELDIFQVALLMDRLNLANNLESSQNTLFFNSSLN